MFACVGSFTTAQRWTRGDGIHIYRLSRGRRDRVFTFSTSQRSPTILALTSADPFAPSRGQGRARVICYSASDCVGAQ
jgi:hypothetical protein